MIDEGYIKFNCAWTEQANDFQVPIDSLLQWRDKMHELKLIGEYEELGIGYGNISIRQSLFPLEFVISGTATGKNYPSKERLFTLVNDVDIDKNSVGCKGPVRASSESMTHAAVYACNAGINAIIHVHHKEMWESLLHKVPTTGESVPYGTPAMAQEIDRLYTNESLYSHKILAMAGHDEGIITFGEDLNEAGAVLLKHFNEFKRQSY
jgi:L-ribulose-5-phosphate 4-epimerase